MAAGCLWLYTRLVTMTKTSSITDGYRELATQHTSVLLVLDGRTKAGRIERSEYREGGCSLRPSSVLDALLAYRPSQVSKSQWFVVPKSPPTSLPTRRERRWYCLLFASNLGSCSASTCQYFLLLLFYFSSSPLQPRSAASPSSALPFALFSAGLFRPKTSHTCLSRHVYGHDLIWDGVCSIAALTVQPGGQPAVQPDAGTGECDAVHDSTWASGHADVPDLGLRRACEGLSGGWRCRDGAAWGRVSRWFSSWRNDSIAAFVSIR